MEEKIKEEQNIMISDFKWTNSLVKLFTQIYSGNFNTKLVDTRIFNSRDYMGKKIDEKMRRFKIDAQKIPSFEENLKRDKLNSVLNMCHSKDEIDELINYLNKYKS
tara:strand:+ start:79 stop:396 length:318 start_codon:yes stop_codon:yes gene_type:complete